MTVRRRRIERNEGMVIRRISSSLYGGPEQKSWSSSLRTLFPMSQVGELQMMLSEFLKLLPRDVIHDFSHWFLQLQSIGLFPRARDVSVRFSDLTISGNSLSRFPLRSTLSILVKLFQESSSMPRTCELLIADVSCLLHVFAISNVVNGIQRKCQIISIE